MWLTVSGLMGLGFTVGCSESADDFSSTLNLDGSSATKLPLRRILERYFEQDSLSSPAVIGRAYADAVRDDAALQRRLDMTIERVAGFPDAAAAALSLEQAVAEDFGSMRIDSLHGWQLSQTELDLCVAAWLVESGPDSELSKY